MQEIQKPLGVLHKVSYPSTRSIWVILFNALVTVSEINRSVDRFYLKMIFQSRLDQKASRHLYPSAVPAASWIRWIWTAPCSSHARSKLKSSWTYRQWKAENRSTNWERSTNICVYQIQKLFSSITCCWWKKLNKDFTNQTRFAFTILCQQNIIYPSNYPFGTISFKLEKLICPYLLCSKIPVMLSWQNIYFGHLQTSKSCQSILLSLCILHLASPWQSLCQRTPCTLDSTAPGIEISGHLRKEKNIF